MQDGGWVEKEHKGFFCNVFEISIIQFNFFSQVFYQSFKVNHMLISMCCSSTLHGALHTVSKEFSGVKNNLGLEEREV